MAAPLHSESEYTRWMYEFKPWTGTDAITACNGLPSFTTHSFPFLMMSVLHDKCGGGGVGLPLKVNWSTEAVTSHHC